MSDIKLLQGDCLEVMKDIPDKSIDMILCDLPYAQTQNPWDNIIPTDELWDAYTHIIKPNGAVVLFCRQPFSSKLVMSNTAWYKYSYVWCKNLKTGNLNARNRPMGSYEEVAVFYEHQPTYNPQKILRTYQQKSGNTKNSLTTNYGKQKEEYTDRQSEWLMPDDVIDGDDIPFTALYYDCVHNSSGKLHPTQKPVELLEYLIKTYTNEGDTVLDNCMGSGSTGVACINTNRNFIGMELDENYFHIAEERIRQAQINPEVPYRKPSNDGIKHKRLF